MSRAILLRNKRNYHKHCGSDIRRQYPATDLPDEHISNMNQIIIVPVEPKFLHELATARGNMDTRSEVVFVLPRPGGKILLISKPFYPDGTYRIPSGGIHPGETPEDAFKREVHEETGLNSEPVKTIERMILRCTAGDKTVDITSHIILGSLTTDTPHPNDPDEQISSYLEADVDKLREVVNHLNCLPGRWAGWGRFRVTAHEVVLKYLYTPNE